jgi:hypothetical protein
LRVHVHRNVLTIIDRLRALGDDAAADRLDAALAGTTSGEILADLGAELRGLVKAGYRGDPEIGPLLVATRDEIDDVTYYPGAWFSRLLRALRRRGPSHGA